MKKAKNISFKIVSLIIVFTIAIVNVTSVHAIDSIVSDLVNISAKEEKLYEEYQLSDLPAVVSSSVNSTEKTPVEIINQDVDDMYSITVKNSDGTNTLHIFQTPIKYEEDNVIKLKKESVTSSKENISLFKNYAFESVENEIKGFYPADIYDGIKIEHGDYEVTLTPASNDTPSITAERSISQASKIGNSVNYSGVFGEDVSIEYSSTLNGIKENIFIEKYNGKNTFDFVINTNGLIPEKMEGDSIPLLDPETQEMQMFIGQINAKDSYIGNNENDEVHFTLYNSLKLEAIDKNKSIYKLTVIVDKEFLENETTVYPVIVDPTVSVGTSNMYDAPVYSGYPNNNYYTNEYNMVGYHGSSYKEAITYIKLNTVSSYKYINPQKIISAKYKVYEGSGKTSSATINVYDTASTWTDSSITYSNRPGFMPAPIHTLTISSSGWYEFNITSLFKNWLEYDLGEGGFTPNYGFALAASTTGVSSRHFCSANSANKLPSFVLDYTEDISIADGEYYIRSKYSDLYLDTEQNVSANGNVIQYGFHGDNNQVWIVRQQDDGYYKLYSPWYDEPKCLNVESNPTQNGSNINVYDDAVNRNSILFKIVSNNDGSYRIISKWSNNQKVLDVCGPSTAPTANIQIWEYVGVNQQKWIFEKKLPKFSTSNASSYSETITSIPYSSLYSDSVSAANNSYKSVAWESLSAEMQQSYTDIHSYATISAIAVSENYPLASDMLLHFLSNSGEHYTIPGNYIYEATEIHSVLTSLQNEIESSYVSLYSPGISIAFGRRKFVDGKCGEDFTDWKLAVNNCDLWAKGYISQSGVEDVLTKEIHVRDYYDWESNYSADLLDLTANVLHLLHVYGLAREYPVSGVYTTSEII